MKIFGDTNSGNCLKVKWVCDRLRLPYRWIDIDTMKGETRTPEFLKLNSAGQCRRSNSTTAVRWRSPTRSSAISRAAAISFPRTPTLPPRWTSGCSGNSTATSPTSRSAASRWCI